jgi:hypothetical protein
MDANGAPRRDLSPRELLDAGHYYFVIGELGRANQFYDLCALKAEDELRGSCEWGLGAVLAKGAEHAAANPRRNDPKCVRRDPPAPLECTVQTYEFRSALSILRAVLRRYPTPRRALVVGQLYERLGEDDRALGAYAKGLNLFPHDRRLSRAQADLRERTPRPECPECPAQPGVIVTPPDCPEMPFGWHRQTGEHVILGSELVGKTRNYIFACFGSSSRTSNVWSYTQERCQSGFRSCKGASGTVSNTVSLRFENDVVVEVSHSRSVKDGACLCSS